MKRAAYLATVAFFVGAPLFSGNIVGPLLVFFVMMIWLDELDWRMRRAAQDSALERLTGMTLDEAWQAIERVYEALHPAIPEKAK